jgi:putative endonuclease
VGLVGVGASTTVAVGSALSSRHGRAFVPAIHALLAKDSVKSAQRSHAGRLGLYHDQPAERHAVRRCNEESCPPRLGTPHNLVEGFTRRYGLKRLVYAEPHDDIRIAIQREKNIKHWPRAWKVRLILDANPAWDDLYDRLV